MNTYVWTFVNVAVGFKAGAVFQSYRWRVTLARHIVKTLPMGRHRDYV